MEFEFSCFSCKLVKVVNKTFSSFNIFSRIGVMRQFLSLIKLFLTVSTALDVNDRKCRKNVRQRALITGGAGFIGHHVIEVKKKERNSLY